MGLLAIGRARHEKIVNQQQEQLKYSAATKYFTEAAKAASLVGTPGIALHESKNRPTQSVVSALQKSHMRTHTQAQALPCVAAVQNQVSNNKNRVLMSQPA